MFCPTCGALLEQQLERQTEERKIVSILFVDLVGFTARSHGADPEDVRAIVAPYFHLLKREVERFGGTVEKFIGDAVMAVFGAPVAHEDDAERAVRAALRITEAMDELSDELGLKLSVRAAVNTGEGLVTLGGRTQATEGMVTGDVVNTASRLQGVAPINGVAVGEMTQRATKDVIDYEPLGAVNVKGKPEPIPIWRAVAAKSRFGLDLIRTPSTPLIGRRFELDFLKNSFRRTLREASAQLVTIVGEPGVGKSRLLSEFFSFIDDQQDIILFRQGRSLPYGEGVTFWALGEIVKAQAGILESDSPDAAADKLRVAVHAVIFDSSDREWFFARLAPLVGAASAAAASAEREESFTAWRRFLDAVAARSPLVAVFEDLHWADDALLEFIEHLVERSTNVPLLVLCTARPELFDKYPEWGTAQRNAATMSLAPLNDSETAQLISGLLSQAVLPANVHAALLERAGGNPLYAEEFVRMLSDRGILREKRRVLTIDPGADIPIPHTVQALIGARIDALTPANKALLRDAAVAGKVFWTGALAAIGNTDAKTVSVALDDLSRKELVRPSHTSSIEGDQEYAFWHALIRDVCYNQIPRSVRAARHRAMAQWLEEISGGRVADHAEVLAHHYTQAWELTTAARGEREASELEEPARRFLVMAGDRALHLDAAKAAAYYRRALALLPSENRERASVLLRAGKANELIGQFTESERYLNDAVSEYQAHGDFLGAGEALARLSDVAWDIGDSTRGTRLLEEAIGILEAEPQGRELCYAYADYSGALWTAGFPSRALESAQKCLSLATELGDEENVVRALGFRGAARCELGDSAGLADQADALRRSFGLSDGSLTATTYNNLASSMELIKGPGPALDLYREGIEFTTKRGFTHEARFMQAGMAWSLYELGDWEEALDQADEVTQWGREHGARQIEIYGLHTRVSTLFNRGYLNEVASVEAMLLDGVRQIGDLQTLVPGLAIAAAIRSARSDIPTAISLIEEMADRTGDSPEWRARELANVSRILVAAGRLELANSLVPDESRVHTTLAKHSLLTARAVMEEGRQNWDEAHDAYEDAAGRWSDYGFVLEQGHALMGAGRCLLAMQRHDDASRRFGEARRIFNTLEARPLMNEVDAELGKVTALSSHS